MKKRGGLYAYLDATGVLNTGDDVLIQQAKQAYYKQYKAAWRKAQRQKTTEITVLLTPSEAQLIFDAAKKHKRSQSAFVKAACLAYLNRRYVLPDILALNAINELLTMNYAALKRLMDEDQLPYQTAATVMNQIAELERSVLNQLRCPASLEDQILEAIRQNSEYKEIVYQLLQKI